MSTQNIRKTAGARGAQGVQRLILELIEGDGASTGVRLPTERVLAERFRVPRSVVRKVMLPLEIEGRITRQVGRGTFVSKTGKQERARTAPTRRLLDVSPAELLEAGVACYPYMSELAVARATAFDLRAIERCVETLKQATTFAEYDEADAAFHQAISDATHNALLIEIARMIDRARSNAHLGELRLHEGTPRDHAGILEALMKRNASLAYERTKTHVLTAQRSLRGAYQPTDTSKP